MNPIRTSVVVEASPEAVWTELAEISDHVEWMADAESITFTTDQRSGAGTTFECVTRVGPIRLLDVMEITEWQPQLSMGVRHVGLVTGEGRFTLAGTGAGSTLVTWTESLSFPWWMGGPLGAWAARPVLGLIWRGNLRRLKRRIEPPGP